MDAVLTRDADKMLCEMYAVYLERRAEGTPKRLYTNNDFGWFYS